MCRVFVARPPDTLGEMPSKSIRCHRQKNTPRCVKVAQGQRCERSHSHLWPTQAKNTTSAFLQSDGRHAKSRQVVFSSRIISTAEGILRGGPHDRTGNCIQN